MLPPLSPADRLALQQLASLYWALADGGEDVSLDWLFAADGVLELGTLRLEGVEAIAHFFAERAEGQARTGRVTRHLATNMLVRPLADGTVKVRSTVIVYAGSGELPIPADLPSGIADFEDVCVRSGSDWLYQSRIGRTVFVGPAAASFAR